MNPDKIDFIEFMVRANVLTFGDFTTKSGRRTPFFINTGNYDSGSEMERLGEFYARRLVEELGDGFDCLYGPAYKGIPLCVAASIALAREFQRDVGFTFNRKEAKDHGEGGSLIGRRYEGGERIVLVEDVTTAGTSVRESFEILRTAVPGGRPNVVALIVSVDRMEKGLSGKSALKELAEEFGIRTFAVATIEEIVQHLRTADVDGRRLIDDETFERIEAYRAEYGAEG